MTRAGKGSWHDLVVQDHVEDLGIIPGPDYALSELVDIVSRAEIRATDDTKRRWRNVSASAGISAPFLEQGLRRCNSIDKVVASPSGSSARAL